MVQVSNQPCQITTKQELPPIRNFIILTTYPKKIKVPCDIPDSYGSPFANFKVKFSPKQGEELVGY